MWAFSAGAHSDYGSLTILAAEDSPGGLQVWHRSGEWIDVPIIPGLLIVNIGDLMPRGRTTAGSRRSIASSTRLPRRRATAGGSRWSSSTTRTTTRVIECLVPGAVAKYPRTTSGEHLRELLTATQNAAARAAASHPAASFGGRRIVATCAALLIAESRAGRRASSG